MIPEIELEALRCFDRTALEGLQIHSRYLRELVRRHEHSLPLRYISSFTTDFGRVILRLQEEDIYEFKVVETREQDEDVLFHLLNNAFVDRLTLTFPPEHRKHDALLYSLRTNANDLQCQIGTLRIEDLEEEVDYSLIEFLCVSLKPHTWETWVAGNLREDHAKLFALDGPRSTIEDLVFRLHGPAPAPECIIPALFDVDVLKTCGIASNVGPHPWIGSFVKMFETAERGAEIVPSVTLLHTRYEEASPLRYDVDPLRHPRRTDVPTPHSAFIEEWLDERQLWGTTTTESPVAELFVFENSKAARKLEVFVWTVETVEQETVPHRRSRMEGLHYAFLLKVSDM